MVRCNAHSGNENQSGCVVCKPFIQLACHQTGADEWHGLVSLSSPSSSTATAAAVSRPLGKTSFMCPTSLASRINDTRSDDNDGDNVLRQIERERERERRD